MFFPDPYPDFLPILGPGSRCLKKGTGSRDPQHCFQSSFFSGLFAKKPRIGFYLDDGLLEPVPAVRRAITAAIGRLQAAGYDVMAAFAPPPMREIVDLFNGMILADGGLGVATSLNWDVADPTVRGLFYGLQLYGLPSPLREEISAINYIYIVTTRTSIQEVIFILIK